MPSNDARKLADAQLRARRAENEAILTQGQLVTVTTQLQTTTNQLTDLGATIDAQPAGSVPKAVSAKLQAIREERGDD